MHEIRQIKSKDMFPAITEIFEFCDSVRITVTGMSMYPFLREGIDTVELIPSDFSSIRRGDIVLVHRVTGEYILHRVLKKKQNSFYIIGDAQQWIEGPLEPDQLIAAVSYVTRGNLRINCKNQCWRALVGIWLIIIPSRKLILKGIRGICKISSIVKKHSRRNLKDSETENQF